MGKNAPVVTDEQIAQIQSLHAEGKGRNEIARTMTMSNRAVDEVCKAHNLRFDSSATAKATEARTQSMKDKRAILADEAINTAIRLNRRATEAYTYYEKNSRDELVRITLPEPPLRDAREAVVGASTAARMSQDLDASLGDPTLSGEKSMLVKLREQIGTVVRDEAEQVALERSE